MNEDEAKAILAEYTKRFHPTLSQKKPKEILFEKQLKFREDPDRRKIALCSRRAGKTTVAADALIEAALSFPSIQCPYIALTRDSAKRIIWIMLLELLERYGISHKVNEQSLTISFQNKSQIFCYGADQKDLIKKLRGSKYGMAVIDEGQSFRPSLLTELVDDVLDAGLADLNGPLWILGTPGPVCAGEFFEWSTGVRPGFSVHHWTILDNPHLDGQGIVDRVIKRNGWDNDHPTVQREWYGRWVDDPSSLLYHFSRSKNVFTEKPDIADPMFVIGIDYGWKDQTAFSVVMYSTEHPTAYIVFSEGYSQMTITQIAAKTKALKERFPHAQIVADTGGLGKSITEELKAREGLHIKAAEKTAKLTAIAIMNDAFQKGSLMVYEGLSDLIHQYQTLQKADNGLDHPAMPNDLVDACLYSFREAKNYIYEPVEPEPSRDSQKYMDRLEQEEAEQVLLKTQKEWWDDDDD